MKLFLSDDQGAVVLRRCVVALGLTLWIGGVVFASFGLMRYATAAGEVGAPPELWPESSAVVRASDAPTLLLFVHPRCPCTRASLGELEALLAAAPQPLRTQVVFHRPDGVPDGWEQSDLWDRAAAMSGVLLCADESGVEARRFGVRTSGHALFYDAAGRLQFSGGITRARGHAGESAGGAALQALVQNRVPGLHEAAVFGCGLFETTCTGEGETSCRP